MNHRDPGQLIRLAATLRLELPEAPIVVHNDEFHTYIAPSVLDPIGNVHLLTSDEPIWWADFGLVAAFWRSMAWMIEHIEFDWLILLSAQDYPIKPLAKLGDYLDATGADVLLRASTDQPAQERRVPKKQASPLSLSVPARGNGPESG